jgi:hypothetical protein
MIFNANNGEAHTIMCYTLVYFQFLSEGAGQSKVNIVSIFVNGYNGSKLFYDSGKHFPPSYIFNCLLLFSQKSGAVKVM